MTGGSDARPSAPAGLIAEVSPSIAALVPTFRRPKDLERCLNALRAQSHPADEVVIVVRDIDVETRELLDHLKPFDIPLEIVSVSVPGQVQAINAGLQRVRSSLVAITDDDAMPHSDWLARIVRAFIERPDVGGVGGRDNVHLGERLIVGEKFEVGVIPKIGKAIGNHHLGAGQPRFVDMLKGVNGAYRTDAIREIGLDPRLKGTGAQVHWEVGLAFRLRAAGWRLWYDPNILVEHYVAVRHDEDQRGTFNPLAVSNAAYNISLLRMERLTPLERLLYLGWSFLVGTIDAPGIAQVVRFIRSYPSVMPRKMRSALAGTLTAYADVRKRSQLRA